MALPTKLNKILRIEKGILEKLDEEMSALTGKKDVIKNLENDINSLVSDRLKNMGLTFDSVAEDVIEKLGFKIKESENELYSHIGISRNNFEFAKVKDFAYQITTEKEGFFLKEENAKNILKRRPPKGVLKYLGYSNVDEMLEREDVVEIFSALRFVEDNEWMHETFNIAYGEFKPEDFEKRPIELRMLHKQWYEIAEKFVAKKHHNVSHLKEFGVIFLNPINQTVPGAFIRDFALFFHYFHELAFYSKLFEKFADGPDFAEKLKSFLRGDLPEKNAVSPGEWLIVQRYLWKENLKDPKLFLPRVNPESLHWHKAENDLIEFGKKNPNSNLNFWDKLDFVGDYFPDKNGELSLVSFDLEDNAMIFSEKQHGDDVEIWYHQQEALWNELFRRYVGKEEMDKLIIENFHKGSIIIK
jgi:hypothetical protein